MSQSDPEPPPRTAPGIRAANRASIEAALISVARQHLAEHGSAGLSLRAIARDLDLAPSALFRYIASRDDLLTRLIVAGYTDLADHTERALADIPTDDLRLRWRTLAHAVRGWAKDHPHDYALLFGTPVPAYHAPAEQTTGPGTRVTTMLAQIGVDAARLGWAIEPHFDGEIAAAQLAERGVRTLYASDEFPWEAMPPAWVANGITTWTLLVGAISAELFEQLGGNLGDPDALFEYTVGVGETILLGRGHS